MKGNAGCPEELVKAVDVAARYASGGLLTAVVCTTDGVMFFPFILCASAHEGECALRAFDCSGRAMCYGCGRVFEESLIQKTNEALEIFNLERGDFLVKDWVLPALA